jgi:excinuclease ABC subunit C
METKEESAELTRAQRVAELRMKVPEEAGVYRYYDAEGKIIYVGKAKNLRKRVNSYFTKQTGHDYKTRAMIGNIAHLEYVVTNNEQEALLLENNLIKQYQPRYNILLKDGKSYPYICVKTEPFPRVFATRQRDDETATYYGPYTSASTMHMIVEFLRENYKLRTCALHLSQRNILAGKFRPCLEFHIGRCLAPCVGKQDEATYNENIREIRLMLRGNFRAVLNYLKDEMLKASERMDFEHAHQFKARIDQVQKLRRKSTVVSETVTDVEVVTLLTQEGLTVVNHFRIISGAIVSARSLESRAKQNESPRELLEAALSLLLVENLDFSSIVLTNEAALAGLPEGEESAPTGAGQAEGLAPQAGEAPPVEAARSYRARTEELQLGDSTLQLRIPGRGDELKLVELSLKNCQVLLDEKLRNTITTKFQARLVETLGTAQKDLRLTKYPRHIECFDNSHIQGYAPVSSAVVFRDGKPAKREYRVYNVRNASGPDDFAWMEDVVFRRYGRFIEEGLPLPDLIVIDGGKGQLSSAISALKRLGIETQVPVIGIAKRLEELYYMDDPVPLYIDKKSPTLHMLQRIRNEAHATAINYHRKKRDAATLRTDLTDIAGVGKATAKKLLQHFRSVDKLRKAPLEEIEAQVGKSKAQAVLRWREGEKG